MSRPTHAGSPTTRAARRGAGRHRLGTPTGVRCSDIPAVRDRFLRAGRWIMRVTGFVFIGLGLKLATEKMHG